MNSIWNKNIKLFQNRFPRLYEIFSGKILEFEKKINTPEEKTLYDFWEIFSAKDGQISATEKITNQKIHSAYSPIKESQKLTLIEFEYETFIFESFGLGYLPLEFARKYPNKNFILIEPDLNYFFTALIFTDFEDLFKIENLILLISCPPEQCINLLSQFSLVDSKIFSVNSQTVHQKEYYSILQKLIERNIQKENLNNATLKKFGSLWIKNSINNLKTNFLSNSILPYKNSVKNKNIPFVIIAAGPTLQEILPFLAELKKRSVLVCVDTALKACLSVNVEPDFIILTDPQYWAFRHISDLKSFSSILITECSVVPSVFRFLCRKVLVCKSNFFLEQYFEILSSSKGELVSGGSVASSAWNFSYFCGADEIYSCGLDLSFPENKTHIKGSQFEEKIHTNSTKINSAQTQSLPLLFSANAEISKNYDNEDVLTDKRMKMFAWWFESRIQECSDSKTFTFSKKSLKIPGINYENISDFIKNKQILNNKEDFINLYKNEKIPSEKEFYSTLKIFIENLENVNLKAKEFLFQSEEKLKNKIEKEFYILLKTLKIQDFVKILMTGKTKSEKFSNLSEKIEKIVQKIQKTY